MTDKMKFIIEFGEIYGFCIDEDSPDLFCRHINCYSTPCKFLKICPLVFGDETPKFTKQEIMWLKDKYPEYFI